MNGVQQYRGESPACAWVGAIVRNEALRQVGRAATNIPIDELAVRGPVELLGRTAPEKVVVDCTSIDWVRCRRAGRILEDIGMENPSLLIP